MSASDSVNNHHCPTFTHPPSTDHDLNYPPPTFQHLVHMRLGPPRESSYLPESYFHDAFRSTPSPPPQPSFLDNILNPTESSFTYPRQTPPPQSFPLPSFPQSPPELSPPMPNSRPPRLPNGYVDLTSEPDQPSFQRTRRRTPTPGPSSKRLKRENGTAAKRFSKTPEPAKIEEIDLSEDAPIQDVLQKQRVEAVKSQQRPEEKATTFNTFNCVICMDTPTDITATSCGHLFCHTCLMEALIAGENRTGPNEPRRSQCPVCRKIINRAKAADIIPLLMKKGLATQPRKSSKVTS